MEKTRYLWLRGLIICFLIVWLHGSGAAQKNLSTATFENVKFGLASATQVRPEWWGAKADDRTDCTAAFASAIAAAGTSKTLQLSEGTYRVTATSGNYAITATCGIRGMGPNVSIIKNIGTGSALLLRNVCHTPPSCGDIYYSRFENFKVIGNDRSEDGITTGTVDIMDADYCAFRSVDSTNHGRHGLVMRNTWATRFIDCKFSDNGGLGVFIDSANTDTGLANGTQFINCEARSNGGTGNAGTDYTKGGVRISGAAALTWLGGVVEANNAWGFIIGADPCAHRSDSVTIDGVYMEDTPRQASSSTVGGLFRATARWNNLRVENCWGSYGGKDGVMAYCFYLTNSLGRDTYDPYLKPRFKEENNWFTRGAYGTNIRHYAKDTFDDFSGERRLNMLTNSGFGVWSNSALQNVGNPISVTDITAGVCSTIKTEGLSIGKLVRFEKGGSTEDTTYVVTAITTDTSFTIHDTSITDATSVTCYEVTPGCVSADALAPDGWLKSYSCACPEKPKPPLLYREFSGTHTKPGAFYGLKIVSNETYPIHGVYQDIKKTGAADSVNAFQHLQDKTVAFGAWVKADDVGVASIQLYDRVADSKTGTQTTSRTNLTTCWEWIEVSRTFPASILDRVRAFLVVNTTGHTVYFAQPSLVFGELGMGNYAVIPQEYIPLESPVTLVTHYNYKVTNKTTNATLYLEAESLGKLPKGILSVDVELSAKQSTINDGDGLKVQPSSTNTGGVRIYPQAANITNSACGFVGVTDDTVYVDYTSSGGTLTTTIDIKGVKLK